MVVDFFNVSKQLFVHQFWPKVQFWWQFEQNRSSCFCASLGCTQQQHCRIQTYIILKPLFWAQGSFKQIFPLKTQNQISLQPLYFLYNREDSKMIIRIIPSDVGRYMCYKPSCLFQLCPHLAWQTSFYLFGTLGIVWVFIWLVFHNENTTLAKDEIPLFVPKVNFPYFCWISVVWTATIAIHFIHYILISLSLQYFVIEIAYFSLTQVQQLMLLMWFKLFSFQILCNCFVCLLCYSFQAFHLLLCQEIIMVIAYYYNMSIYNILSPFYFRLNI